MVRVRGSAVAYRIQTPVRLLQTVQSPRRGTPLAVMDMLQRRVSGTVRLVVITAWRWKKVPRPESSPDRRTECLRQPTWRKRGFPRPPSRKFLTGCHRLAIAINLGNARLISTASGTVLMRLASSCRRFIQLCSGTLRPIRG